MDKYIFSQTSITGKLPENPNPDLVLTDALNDWGNCMAGAKPPANFGNGMVEVHKLLGGASPDYLMKLAKQKTNNG